MKNAWFFGGCIVFLIGLIFFMPSYGWKIRSFLSPQASGDAASPNMAAQNQALLSELAELQVVAAELPLAPADYLRAMVYSRYPLNFKNQLLLNAGANQGVVPGKAVIFQGVLLGKIESTFADSAIVTTIFDANFKIPVRIGASGTDGLLTGGAYPRVTSIGKNAKIAPGDVVYNAASSLPYALPIGTLTATSTSADGLFAEAGLSLAYDLNTVETVLIAK